MSHPYALGQMDIDVPDVEQRTHHRAPPDGSGGMQQHVRLPAVPVRTDQLLEKVVSKNLMERQWVSSLTPMDTFSPTKKLGGAADYADASLADPHLQVYWERKFALGKIQRSVPRRSKRRAASQQSQHKAPASTSSSSATRLPQRSATAELPGNNDNDDDGEYDDEDFTMDGESSRGSSLARKDQHHHRQHHNNSNNSDHRRQLGRCPIPLNERPITEDEVFCLKTLLCPAGDLQSTVKLDHMDLRWLRGAMQQQGGGDSPSRGRKRNRGESDSEDNNKIPSPLLNLRNFNVTALENDSTHHTPDIPFHEALINSPRSALILIRNGVEAYRLLQRPPTYYIQPCESVSSRTLRLRHELAENERLMLVESLRSQYDQLCGMMTVERVVECLCSAGKQTIDLEHCQDVAQERFQRDFVRLKKQEARQKRFGDLLLHQEEEATKRLLETEEKIRRNEAEHQRQLKERGEWLKQEAEKKQKMIAHARAQQQQTLEEMALQMEQRREEKQDRIRQLKDEKIHEMRERASESAKRIEESRQKMLQLQKEEMDELIELGRIKKELAAAFQERKLEEHKERVKRSGDEGQRREYVKRKAAESLANIRETIESKLTAAEARYEAFQQERNVQMRIQKVLHHAREVKSQRALRQAQEAEEQATQEIIRRSEIAAARLERRRHMDSLQKTQDAEEHGFDIAQRGRIVQTKQHQSEFEKLLMLSRMQLQEEMRELEKLQEAEVVRLTREGDKKMRLHRKASKAAMETRLVEKAKQSFRKQMDLQRSYSEDAAITASSGSMRRRSSSTTGKNAMDEDQQQQQQHNTHHRSRSGDRSSSMGSRSSSSTSISLCSSVSITDSDKDNRADDVINREKREVENSNKGKRGRPNVVLITSSEKIPQPQPKKTAVQSKPVPAANHHPPQPKPSSPGGGKSKSSVTPSTSTSTSKTAKAKPSPATLPPNTKTVIAKAPATKTSGAVKKSDEKEAEEEVKEATDTAVIEPSVPAVTPAPTTTKEEANIIAQPYPTLSSPPEEEYPSDDDDENEKSDGEAAQSYSSMPSKQSHPLSENEDASSTTTPPQESPPPRPSSRGAGSSSGGVRGATPSGNAAEVHTAASSLSGVDMESDRDASQSSPSRPSSKRSGLPPAVPKPANISSPQGSQQRSRVSSRGSRGGVEGGSRHSTPAAAAAAHPHAGGTPGKKTPSGGSGGEGEYAEESFYSDSFASEGENNNSNNDDRDEEE